MMQKKNKKMELIGIISVILCLTIGIVCDWNVLIKKNILIPVDDIQSFSLTILQIQATIGTLIFTIIALITGSISDSYMGISISDFYLSIKPWKLTQKKLIIISLGLCLAGVVFHSLGLYNVVFYLFIATLVVVLISINEIYSAFKGKNKQNNEIETYIYYMLESDIEYSKKLNVFQNFVLDWENVFDSQNQQSYDKFLEIFEKGMSAIWDYRTDEALSAIEQQCYSVSYCLLKSDKKILQEYGIEFVQEIYDRLWSFILNGIEKKETILNEYERGFPFFTEIYSELIQSIDEMTVEDVEKRFNFANFVDSVLRISIWFSYKKDNEDEEENEKMRYRRYRYNYQSDVNELSSFARYMGVYLRKQNNRNNIVNQEIWANVLNSWSSFSAYNIPEERQEIYLKSKLSIYFGYCYGMLVNGQEEVVKQGLYLQGMKQVLTSNKYQFLLYLTVHCYVYYLAVRENDDCVTEKIRHSARNIWEDPKIKDAFLDYLNILAENSQWINLDILRQMENVMNGYELFSQNGTSKVMMIESVISEFYIFFVVFMSCEFNLPELLERNVDDSRMIWYVSKANEKTTKEMFTELFKMIYMENKVDEQIEAEVNLMYDSFEKAVKKKHKERRLRSAMESQANYETNEEKIGKKIQRDIAHRLRERFAPILVENDDTDDVIIIDLLNISDYTDLVGQRSIAGYYFDIDGAFLRGIERFLLNKKALETKNRFKDFENDKEFMEYLSANNQYLLFGSQLILKNSNYKNRAEFNEFLDKCKTIYTVGELNGIALKEDSIQVCLHEVKVSICSPSIEEENVNYNEQTGKYYYSIINGLPVEFEKDELIEFLYNERKVIKVTAKVSIQVNEIPVGTVFTGRSVHE